MGDRTQSVQEGTVHSQYGMGPSIRRTVRDGGHPSDGQYGPSIRRTVRAIHQTDSTGWGVPGYTDSTGWGEYPGTRGWGGTHCTRGGEVPIVHGEGESTHCTRGEEEVEAASRRPFLSTFTRREVRAGLEACSPLPVHGSTMGWVPPHTLVVRDGYLLGTYTITPWVVRHGYTGYLLGSTPWGTVPGSTQVPSSTHPVLTRVPSNTPIPYYPGTQDVPHPRTTGYPGCTPSRTTTWVP